MKIRIHQGYSIILLSILLFFSACFDNPRDNITDPGSSGYIWPTVEDPNTAPVANAGSYGYLTIGGLLTGSGSDPDGDTITYHWSEVTSYGVTFANADAAETAISGATWNDSLPVVNVTLRLTVSDGSLNATSDTSLKLYRNDYVYVDINQTGNGSSPLNAMPDITNAISAAASSNKKGVAAASGTYNVISGSNHVVLVEGISLFGGYLASDWSRDMSINITVIQDNATAAGNSTDPTRAVEGNSGITTNTVIDGFTISGSGNSTCYYTSAVYLNGGSPVIRNCLLNGGGNINTSSYSSAIYTSSSSASIINNTINGGIANYCYGINSNSSSLSIECNEIVGGDANDQSYPSGLGQVFGISCYSPTGSFIIRNNTIDAGRALGYNANSHGIYCSGSSSIQNTPVIQNNAIDGGLANTGSGNTYGIYLMGNFTPRIENNIIFTSDTSGYCYGIYEYTDSSDPATSCNNNVFDCPSGLYYDYDYTASMLGIYSYNGRFREAADGESGYTPYNPPLDSLGNYSGNNKKEVLIFDSEFRFTGTLSDVTFDTGGLNLSSEFLTDKDGNTRTAPWSIGPYEY